MMPSQFGIGRSSEIMGKLYALDKPLFVTPDLMSMMTSRHRVSQVASEPLVDITNANISPLAVNLKRLGDMVLASAALLVLVRYMRLWRLPCASTPEAPYSIVRSASAITKSLSG